MFLLHKDEKVLEFDLDKNKFQVLTEKMFDSFMQRACRLGLYEECMPTLGQKLHLKKYNKYRIKNGSI